MPAFNASRWIEEAVMSVRHQKDFEDLELIVVDDGSTDDTPRKLTALAREDSRIQVHRTDHQGVVAARNLAMRLARGVYIATLDADDKYHPDKLTKQWELMQEDTDAVACYTAYREIDASGKVKRASARKCFGYQGHIAHRAIMSQLGALALTMFFRRSCLGQIKLPEPDSAGLEDRELFLRLALLGKVRYIPELLGYYRKGHNGNNNVSAQGTTGAFVTRNIAAINKNDMAKIAAHRGRDEAVIAPDCPWYKLPSVLWKIKIADRLNLHQDPQKFADKLRADVYLRAARKAEREIDLAAVGKYARAALKHEPDWFRQQWIKLLYNTSTEPASDEY